MLIALFRENLPVRRVADDDIKAGRMKRGGSTISMQVIRMSRGKDRTIWQKVVETVLATRLELRYSKSKILALYASHAPFGGNVVGIRAASWRYFGHPCEELSWSEAATLAVLPNSPSLMHPGKNRDLLMEKRNRLLGRLLEKGVLDTLTYELSCEEPLPDKPLPLPGLAYHLVERAQTGMPGSEINSTIIYGLQRSLESMTDRWQRELSSQGVNDLCAVVIDVHSGKLAWKRPDTVQKLISPALHAAPEVSSSLFCTPRPYRRERFCLTLSCLMFQ